jgi:hypothetical protein
MRRLALIVAFCLAAAVAGGTASASPAGSGGTRTGFAGVYVTTHQLSSIHQNLPDDVYQSAAPFGISIRLEWNVIEPNENMYDWSTLDAEVTRAVASGRKISLAVATGIYTPGWLYTAGADHDTFIVNFRPRGDSCLTITIPMPWDRIYLRAYAAMMYEMSAHLRGIPGAMNAVQLVKVTPINEWSDEMHMPYEAGPLPGQCQSVSNAVAIFQSHGYRPQKVIRAWRLAAQSVLAAFPGRVLGIAIWNTNDFPPIDRNGNALNSDKDPGWVDVKHIIIKTGTRVFPQRFEVQWNAIGESEVSSVVIDAGRGGAIEGWQTNLHLGSTRQAACDSSPHHDNIPCVLSAYRDILEEGHSTGGQYIEIWPNDALAFPSALSFPRVRTQ